MKTYEYFIWLVVLVFCFVVFAMMWINNLELQRKYENLQIKNEILQKANNSKDQEINWLNWTLLSVCKTSPNTSTKKYKESKLKIK